MILVNGESKQCVDVSDRGFQYGDGLFETIEIKDGHPFFLLQHLSRLKKGCSLLSIPFPDHDLITDEVYRLIKNTSQAVLKLIITRGTGGRGYRPPESIKPTRVISLHPFPEFSNKFSEEGINVRFCNLKLGHNPRLAGLKHMNRLEQVLARGEWCDNRIQEGLMLDLNDQVIEGTMSNLFVVRNGQLCTPILDRCGVAGIIRQMILESSSQLGIRFKLVHLTKQDVLTADELFVTNSIIGLWPMRKLEQAHFEIGPITRQLSSGLQELKQRDLQHGI